MAKAYLDCLTREEAQRLWQERLTAMGYFRDIPYETIALQAACGRVTARCEYARQSVPHYNGAAMDGIAIKAADSFGAAETNPKRLQLIKTGQPFTPGCCYIIDTGDPLPAGTDAVVMREDINIAGDQAEITAAAFPWQHVRIIGEDIVVHEMVLPEHHLIYPVDIAAALAAGLEHIDVIMRPRVTVIPTGSELVACKADLETGKILDVNSHMLCAFVEQWGGSAVRHAIVPDDYGLLKQAIASSLADSDMIITNAGTSAGTEDFTAGVLADLGEVLVHGVSIKPGKPVVLAVCQGKPVIGLPGYPVSAALTAELFVKPVLQQRQQVLGTKEPVLKANLVKQAYSNIGTEEYLRVSLGSIQGKTIAAPMGRGAGLITSLARADGIVVVDAGTDGIAANREVEVRLLRPEGLHDTLIAIGSHDLSLDILSVYLRRSMDLSLACANVGSMGGIMAIRNREAHVAGIHILDPETGEYNISTVKKYLHGRTWSLLSLGAREQGLLLAAGNPKQIQSLADLAQNHVSFVNRQRGSGTRMLLDHKLGQYGINPNSINGYEQEVGTHMAVAASVSAGIADAGLGIRAAANALGLDFIPVGYEQYDLLLAFPATARITAKIAGILQSEAFRQEIEGLGGYDLSKSGLIRAEGNGVGD